MQTNNHRGKKTVHTNMNGKVQAHNKKKLNVEGGCHTHCARVNKDQFRFY